MPKENRKLISVDNIRHSEYYGLQETFDRLYAQSKNGEIFTNLMEIILSRENILLAYRNIKANTGSHTPGTDRQTIRDIGRLTPEEVVDKVRFIVAGSPHGYRPKPVRRKDIPKPYDPTKSRPLGIPCIWDRLIQQCIKQVMEPICEAKFSNNSFGFRPNRSVEHAIAKTYRLLNLSHLHYVVEFDIKGFFDNVNHSKLVRQIWSMGIRDKHLIYIIRCILKAPIRMPDGSTVQPGQGTPQGGIISPLLANIVLNELDHWVESQWQANPVTRKYSVSINRNGSECLHHGYRAMRNTGLKEMFIIRYADDFRVFCRTKTDAERAKYAVTQWLSDRLKLEVSPEKTIKVSAFEGNISLKNVTIDSLTDYIGTGAWQIILDNSTITTLTMTGSADLANHRTVLTRSENDSSTIGSIVVNGQCKDATSFIYIYLNGVCTSVTNNMTRNDNAQIGANVCTFTTGNGIGENEGGTGKTQIVYGNPSNAESGAQ